jgi:hypothetical protein
MRDHFRSLPVAIASFFLIAAGLMIIPAFGQGPDDIAPMGPPSKHAGPPPGMPSPSHFMPPHGVVAPRSSLVEHFADLKEKLGRLIREASLKLFSGNETNLLSGNSPKLLSENEPKILSGNKTQVLSGNRTPILSGNRISLFSGLKIEIHIENNGNNSGNPIQRRPRLRSNIYWTASQSTTSLSARIKSRRSILTGMCAFRVWTDPSKKAARKQPL